MSIFCSCIRNTADDDPTNNEPIPYLTDSVQLYMGNRVSIETPLFYNDKVILMIEDSESQKAWIECRDKNTFEVLWKWQEAYNEYGTGARGFGSDSHIYQNILAIAQNNISYGIDINDGSTIWKNIDDSGVGYVKGVNDIIISSDSKILNEYESIRKANVSEGNWTDIFELVKDDSLNIALVLPEPFIWNGIEYCTFVSSKWSQNPQIRIFWLNLYNLTENKLEWTSDTIPLEFTLSGTPGGRPTFHDGQILLANDAIYSYNIEDGSLEWWKWFGNSFVFSSHLTAAAGKVFANNGDKYFIGLDVHTGQEYFRTTTGGSPSKIVYHDNKCYMAEVSAGGLSHLMVIDATTGEILFDMTAPFFDNLGENKNWTFDRVCAVDPETGYVYVSDHNYLLVYDIK